MSSAAAASMFLSGATLVDCYTPLEVPSTSSVTDRATRLRSVPSSSKRSSGDGTSSIRSNRALRRLHLSTSILSKSDGSAVVELGHTKVLCSVHGPRSAAASSLTGGRVSFNAGGTINCEVRLAPSFGLNPQTAVSAAVSSLDGRAGVGQLRSRATTQQEIELSSGLADAIAPTIRLDRLPKSVVDVFVLVLQSDGSVLPSAITAASLALADAGIELFDLVSSCSVAVIDSDEKGSSSDKSNKCELTLLADPTEKELIKPRGEVTLAVLPNWREVTFWEQTGRIPPGTCTDAVELCRDGCETIYRFMRECLVMGQVSSSVSNSSVGVVKT
eukprot:CAMPEP_0178507044 /NCGR_PEP_ID=MMETSP0696-20121128/20011_1 /TAXON_ID=265572 /ORGANISM="Extubocellulus spinifer, Strain CCMP396" /LENGTH=329 /DNA_ID=CAMNT_0020136509 /DNA_START=249 /DNA_END=1238 /DNA_ORIENTATION=+